MLPVVYAVSRQAEGSLPYRTLHVMRIYGLHFFALTERFCEKLAIYPEMYYTEYSYITNFQ